MKTYREKVVKDVDQIICDVCNETAKDAINLWHVWNYNSKHDGDVWECDICENCAEKIKNFIESLGGKVIIKRE